MTDLIAKLSAPFPPDAISWRVGSTTKDKTKGMALAYLDSRDVQDRLNQVCGENWQVRHPWSVNTKLACEIGIKIDGEWVWRGDGAGDSDVEADKGAFSDSFKRAAVRWGIGRYLYDLDSPWVQLEPRGLSYVIAKSELGKLRDLLYRTNKTVAPHAREPAAATPFDEPRDDDRSPADDFYEQAKITISNHIDGPTLQAWVDANMGHLNALPKEKAQALYSQYTKRLGALAQAPGKAA